MRRKEREIQDIEKIKAILKRGTVCHLAMVDGQQPYVLPLSYGYDGENIYIHCAKAGRKIDILKKNNQVCFEVSDNIEVVSGKVPCGWTMHFQSVIGTGTAVFLETPNEKIDALNCIMHQYSSQSIFTPPEKMLDMLCIIKIEIETLTGKASPNL